VHIQSMKDTSKQRHSKHILQNVKVKSKLNFTKSKNLIEFMQDFFFPEADCLSMTH
jgi:hypothetical protein